MLTKSGQLLFFKGVCLLNYHHPGPRREWNLGSELPAVTHFRQIRGIRWIEAVSSTSCKFLAPVSENEPDVVLALCVFDFFMDVSCESPTFETLFGRVASRNGLETYGFA